MTPERFIDAGGNLHGCQHPPRHALQMDARTGVENDSRWWVRPRQGIGLAEVVMRPHRGVPKAFFLGDGNTRVGA